MSNRKQKSLPVKGVYRLRHSEHTEGSLLGTAPLHEPQHMHWYVRVYANSHNTRWMGAMGHFFLGMIRHSFVPAMVAGR